MFMIHERKLQSTHKIFVDILKEKLPALKVSSCALVTDGESSFDVFEEVFPKTNKLICWNHLLRATKQWLKRHNATSPDIVVYLDHIQTLLHCPTDATYLKMYHSKVKLWSQPFKLYYDNTIHKYIGTKIGRVVLERLNVYDKNSGITQNMSEGFNTVMRRVHEWEEVSIDMSVLILYHLQSFYINNINLGFGDQGDYYLLKDEFPHLALARENIIIEKVLPPEELVSEMKRRNNDFKNNVVKEEKNICTSSEDVRAQTVLETTGSIQFNSSLKCFLVKGTSKDIYLVRLNGLKKTCSCRPVKLCYHIKAVQRLVGAPVISENKSINLTQLRRNKRTAKQRLGRKKPQVGDCDVNAAPDAESDNDKNENKEIVSKNYEEYNAIMEKFSSLEYEDAEARVVGLSSEDKFVISSCTVNREDLATLNSNEWLNDTVIHAYLNLLMDLNKAKKGNQVYVLPSFLAQRWHEKNLQGWLYTKVRLCKYKWILLPLHVNNSHWILLIANTLDKTVGIADSLNGDNSLKLDMFTRYMASRCSVTNELGVWNKVVFNAPQQLDGDSCGIFTLMFAEAIINNVNINAVDPTAVTLYRRYIRARIVHRMRTNVDNEDICDIPFCVKPRGARLTWSQCDQCDRWCHDACAPHQSSHSTFYCSHCI
jgi:hypothetical protein